MDSFDLLYNVVGPDKAVLDLEDYLFGSGMEARSHKPMDYLKVLFCDWDNTVANTNEILTEKWLKTTFWRHFLNKDIEKVDMDEFYCHPEKVGIPAILSPLFKLDIALSLKRLTRELAKMAENGEKIAIEGAVETIQKLHDAGIETIFLTNRSTSMWKETKKQVSIVLGRDDGNVVLHMRRGVKKEEVVCRHLAYCSVGLVDDKLPNLASVEGKISILFGDEPDDVKHDSLIKTAKNWSEVERLLANCQFDVGNAEFGPTLWVESH